VGEGSAGSTGGRAPGPPAQAATTRAATSGAARPDIGGATLAPPCGDFPRAPSWPTLRAVAPPQLPLAHRAADMLPAVLAVVLAAALAAAPSRPPTEAAPLAPLPLEAALDGTGGGPATSPPPTIARPRADAKLDRSGRTAFGGGYLALTPDFASPDGIYDVVIHFHGNTELVEQSLAYAHIGAVFVPQNLGVGSAPYEARFSPPAALPELLDRVQVAMERRGLAEARLGRVALIAWSAGYGAVLRILEHPEVAERIDAILLLDGIHIGRVPGRRAAAVEQVAPYERFARWAVEGRKLFTITHSDIAPDAYVGARETTDVLLRRLGVLRYAGGEEGEVPDIPAAEHVLSRELRVPLQPLTLAESGRLTVRGYAGDRAEHHVHHLLEMATIALPDLAAWWARPREASP
jgi:hypothetical protein